MPSRSWIGTEGGKGLSSKNNKKPQGTDVNAPETAGTKMKRLAQGRAADQDEKAFEMVGRDAPQEVKDAWMDAAKEVNANGMGIRGSGMMSHIPQMMVIENKGPSLFLFFNKGEGYIPFEWLLLQLQQMR